MVDVFLIKNLRHLSESINVRCSETVTQTTHLRLEKKFPSKTNSKKGNMYSYGSRLQFFMIDINMMTLATYIYIKKNIHLRRESPKITKQNILQPIMTIPTKQHGPIQIHQNYF